MLLLSLSLALVLLLLVLLLLSLESLVFLIYSVYFRMRLIQSDDVKLYGRLLLHRNTSTKTYTEQGRTETEPFPHKCFILCKTFIRRMLLKGKSENERIQHFGSFRFVSSRTSLFISNLCEVYTRQTNHTI